MKPPQKFSVSVSNLEIQKIKNSRYPSKFPKFHGTPHHGRSYKDMMMRALKSTLIADLYITNTTSCSKIKRQN